MTEKAPDLEHRLATRQVSFKSAGERRIAEYLEGCRIRYDYERPLLVIDQGKPKIWYPDFTLPQLAVYLEYYGITGDPDYDRCTRHKRDVYKAMELDVIPVYPATFRADWQGYIMDSLRRVTERRQRTLGQKQQHRLPSATSQYASTHARGEYPRSPRSGLRGTGYR